MVSITRFCKGGITIKEMMELSLEDYNLLKRAVENIAKMEEREIKKRIKR